MCCLPCPDWWLVQSVKQSIPCSRPQAITGAPEVYAAALYASKGPGFGGEGDWVEGYKLEGVSQAYYQP